MKIDSLLPEGLIRRINKELCGINLRTAADNFKTSQRIALTVILSMVVYAFIAFIIMHNMWYHKVIALISTLLFGVSMTNMQLDAVERKVKSSFPKMLRDISSYYRYFKGNVIATLEKVIERGTKEIKPFMALIMDALEGEDRETEINEVRERFKYNHLKILCNLLLSARIDGNTETEDKETDDIIGKNLDRLEDLVNYIDIQQSKNDAQLYGFQSFNFLAPFVVIPATRLVNFYLIGYLEIPDAYLDSFAQNLAAVIMLAGNLISIYLQWIRKVQS